jgi:hypothetical protein
MEATLRLSVLCALLLLLPATVSAAERRANVWDIAIGSPVSSITGRFVDIACGTNGGPPSIAIDSFSAFATCPPEPSGLHEVYFRYDDRLEYRARALEQAREIARIGGTRLYDFPVIVSVLIDDTGTIRGRRIVSDPRPNFGTNRSRHEFWTLGNLLRRSLSLAWDCASREPANGERPVGSLFVKASCTAQGDGTVISLSQHFFHKSGQTFIDPHTGKYLPDAFESESRFEEIDARFIHS